MDDVKRECKCCALCCIVCPVTPLDLPAGVPCHHLTPPSNTLRCSIYSERPQACKVFACEWLSGKLPIELRPDVVNFFVEKQWVETRVGVLYMLTANPLSTTVVSPEFVMSILEPYEGQERVFAVLIDSRGLIGDERSTGLCQAFFAKLKQDGEFCVQGSDGVREVISVKQLKV